MSEGKLTHQDLQARGWSKKMRRDLLPMDNVGKVDLDLVLEMELRPEIQQRLENAKEARRGQGRRAQDQAQGIFRPKQKDRLEIICEESALRSARAGQSADAAYRATKKAVRARAKEIGTNAALAEAEAAVDLAAIATARRLLRNV